MTLVPSISKDTLHQPAALGLGKRGSYPANQVTGEPFTTNLGIDFLKAFLSSSAASGVQQLAAQLHLSRVATRSQMDLPASTLQPSRTEFSARHSETADPATGASDSHDAKEYGSQNQPWIEERRPGSLDELHNLEFAGFSGEEPQPLVREPEIGVPVSMPATFSPEHLDGMAANLLASSSVATQPVLPLAAPPEVGVAKRIQEQDPRVFYTSRVYETGEVKLDPQVIKSPNLTTAEQAAIVEALQTSSNLRVSPVADIRTAEIQRSVGMIGVETVAPRQPVDTTLSTQVRLETISSSSTIRLATGPDRVNTESLVQPVVGPIEAIGEALEVTFTPNQEVSQKSEAVEQSGNKRRTNRSDSRSNNSLKPGFIPNESQQIARTEQIASAEIGPDSSSQSLETLPVLPNGQRAWLDLSADKILRPEPNAAANFETETSGSVVVSAASTVLASPAAVLPVAAGTSQTPQVTTTLTAPIAVNSVDGEWSIATEGPARSLPSRLLHQVTQALRQAPPGDSIMRLQLNPLELGNLAIEISFRDGAMHGRLRAEQGQTMKLLQEGLESLRTRLNEQGITVQTLEVELGQQGDFSQQHRSFSQMHDFGKQRHSGGYFTDDAASNNRGNKKPDAATDTAVKDQSGRWAVNVIV